MELAVLVKQNWGKEEAPLPLVIKDNLIGVEVDYEMSKMLRIDGSRKLLRLGR